MLAFGDVALPSGSRPSSDGRDLAGAQSWLGVLCATIISGSTWLICGQFVWVGVLCAFVVETWVGCLVFRWSVELEFGSAGLEDPVVDGGGGADDTAVVS